MKTVLRKCTVLLFLALVSCASEPKVPSLSFFESTAAENGRLVFVFVQNQSQYEYTTAHIITNPDDILKAEMMSYEKYDNEKAWMDDFGSVIISEGFDRKSMAAFNLPPEINKFGVLLSAGKNVGTLRYDYWKYLSFEIASSSRRQGYVLSMSNGAKEVDGNEIMQLLESAKGYGIPKNFMGGISSRKQIGYVKVE